MRNEVKSGESIGWVACAERLPGNESCFYGCVVAKSNGVVMEAMFNGKTQQFYGMDFNEIKSHPVTYWMPLPKPPNVESEGFGMSKENGEYHP